MTVPLARKLALPPKRCINKGLRQASILFLPKNPVANRHTRADAIAMVNFDTMQTGESNENLHG